jgi:hypothetical protein
LTLERIILPLIGLVMKKYNKYNNMDFEEFNLDIIMNSMEDSSGFILSTVFQKKFSLDVNLKRHEDMKNWLKSKNLDYLVLDGVQKVIDQDNGKVLDYSILYILLFYRNDKLSEQEFQELAQILLKRYDLKTIITKLPNSRDLETWNRDAERKVFRNITSNNMESLIKGFFLGLNKKREKFYFLGIEKENLEKNVFFRKIEKKQHSNDARAIA